MLIMAFARSLRRSIGGWLVMGASLLFLPVMPAASQEPPAAGPLASIAKRLGTTKATATKPGNAASATKFTPSGKRILAPKLADSIGDSAEEKKALNDLFEKALTNFEAETKKAGMANDVAPALAFFVQIHWSIYSGKEASDAGADKMIGQIRALLDTPEMAQSSNADKQNFSEYCVCMSALTLTLYQVATEGKNAEGLANLRATAGESLKKILGAEPDKIAITARGLEISGTSADVIAKSSNAVTPPSTGAAKVTYTAPPDSKVEQRGGTTILYRPRYDGVTKNENGAETLYYAILPVVPSAGKPDREAAFEDSWKALTDSLKVTWPNRTLVHRFYLPSGAVCYVAMAGYRANETFGGYGDCDGARMTLCLLDFGSYYVPVAQVYSWTTGKDNLNYLQGHFDAFIPTVRVAGATAPRPFATRQQVVGDWSHTDGYYSSTDYVYRSSGGYAGNVTNSSSSRHTLKLRADGTCRYDFFWLYNGVVRTDVWDGTWTYDKGRITLKNPKTGKTDEYSLLYNGKHPKTGERFLVLHRVHSRDNPLTPMNAHSTDSKLYAPFKPKG
jgi:hypothetical protein